MCALGEPINVPTLARVLGWSTRRARELAERLVGLGAACVENGPARVRMYALDAQCREHAERMLSTRPAVHARVAAYLERSAPEQRRRIAEHLVAAGAYERAAEYLEAEAVAASQRRDPVAARGALQRALEILPRGHARVAVLEERRASAARDLGTFAEAERGFARSAELYLAQARRDDAARALLSRARAWLPLAVPRRALTIATRASALARDERLLVEVTGFRAVAGACSGETVPADGALAPASAETALAEGLRAFANGAVRLAASAFESALARAESSGEERIAQESLLELGRAILWCGETERARELADEAVARASAFGFAETLQRAHLRRAELLRLCGDYDAAHDDLLRVLRTWRSIPRDDAEAYAWGVPIALRLGDAEALRRCARREVLRATADLEAAPWRADVAHAYVLLAEDAGERDRACAMIERTLATLRSGAQAAWLLLDAARLGVEQQRSTLLLRAAAANARTAPYDAVDLLFRAYRSNGPEAERLARDAAARFDALGWRDARDAARRRFAPRPSEEPGGLTARQSEVARLVAAGRTNREIAGALRISVHTVEHHVTAILRRRGLRSRWQLTDPSGFRDGEALLSPV